MKPLVVMFNHGFIRSKLQDNCAKTFSKLGVDVHEFTPKWDIVRKLMLQSFIDKGDFCWHCHTGIFAYPMQVAIKERIPLILWGEPTAEYTGYYDYAEQEEADEERFNRITNLGITADDMWIRLGGTIDDRDLDPFRYPDIKELRKLNYRSLCLGSYIPWDVKTQVDIIKKELDWEGDNVENVPPNYDYEKIECWMQGVRDYIKYIKRGYTRPTHLAAIDLRNNRISKQEGVKMIQQYEGKKPPSLEIFLEYIGLTEEEFYEVAKKHQVSPWSFDDKIIEDGNTLDDFNEWRRGDGIDRSEAYRKLEEWRDTCSSCEKGIGCQ